MRRIWQIIFPLLVVVCFLSLFQSVSASAIKADMAFLVTSPTTVDLHILTEITNLGYSYELISESNIPTTDFSAYRMIIVGNQRFSSPSLIPAEQYKTLVINSYNYYLSSGNYQLGWSGYAGSKSSPTTLLTQGDSEIIQGLPSQFTAYTSSIPSVSTSYLQGAKPSGISAPVYASPLSSDMVVATLDKGSRLLNGKTLQQANVFFGITGAQYWTPETRKLFNNSISWLLKGEDLDGDGFYSDVDCNDRDATINPNATEIPYDGIDQDCSGADLADVDGDGFCKSGYVIQNAALQCPLETGPIGTDCNDNNATVNTNNRDVYNNCKNDAPIIPQFSNAFSFNEGELVRIIVNAVDPENDTIAYSINDSRFSVNGNMLSWQTTFEDAGFYTFNITASDGELSSSTLVQMRINNVNRAPQSSLIPDLVWNEDSNLLFNISSFFSDPDLDPLTYGIAASSPEKNIAVSSIANGIFNFSSIKDFFGTDWVIFWASDGKNRSYSNRVNLVVNPVNDAPTFVKDIPNLSINENSNNVGILNLSDYFRDIDSNLSFTAIDNENIYASIVNGQVTLKPDRNFNGTEEMYFVASDGEFTIYSNNFTINVNEVNDAPQFVNVTCNTSILEDTPDSCVLQAVDEENDPFAFYIVEQNNTVCTLNGTILNYIPQKDYNGLASCVIGVSDGNASSTYSLNITVLPVNDAPILVQNIPNVTIVESTPALNKLNLSDYFKDIDSKLTFDVIYPSHQLNSDVVYSDNINVTIVDGMVSFYPKRYYNGEEPIAFAASDGEFTLNSNPLIVKVIPVNDPPVFDNLSCETSIAEDMPVSCVLHASDPENDSLVFSVHSQNRLNCTVSGNVLNYVSQKDYNGLASCVLAVSDGVNTVLQTLNVNVTPVNDAPVISSYSPNSDVVSVVETKSQEFSLNATDVDSNLLYFSWLINGERIALPSNQKTFTFSKPSGAYLLQAEVSDGNLTTERNWNVVVGQISQFSCSAVGGDICSDSEYCSSNILGVKDTSNCCATACSPVFKVPSQCTRPNENLVLQAIYPNADDEITLGDNFLARYELSNDANTETSGHINIYIYDLEAQRYTKAGVVDWSLGAGASAYYNLNVNVPEDLNLDHNYVVYAKTDGAVCAQNYTTLKIQRPENKVVATNFELPATAKCGDDITARVRLENLGSEDQTVYFRLENGDIGISNTSSKFVIERAGRDDSVINTVNIHIPEKAETGSYPIKLSVVSSNQSAETHTRSIDVECVKEQVSQQTIPAEAPLPIKLSSVTTVKKTSAGDTGLAMTLLGVNLMLIALTAVLYFVFLSRKKALIKVSPSPTTISIRKQLKYSRSK